MKKLSTWMLVLMLAPGLVALTGCKKEEAPAPMDETPMAEEATPAPMEPMAEPTPMMEATPAMDAAATEAAPAASPAAP